MTETIAAETESNNNNNKYDGDVGCDDSVNNNAPKRINSVFIQHVPATRIFGAKTLKVRVFSLVPK